MSSRFSTILDGYEVANGETWVRGLNRGGAGVVDCGSALPLRVKLRAVKN